MKNDTLYDKIWNIHEECLKLKANEKYTTSFGKNNDLTLHFWKDEDYHPEIDKSKSNMVTISTFKDGIAIDDTGDIHLDDYREFSEQLERIFEERDMETL